MRKQNGVIYAYTLGEMIRYVYKECGKMCYHGVYGQAPMGFFFGMSKQGIARIFMSQAIRYHYHNGEFEKMRFVGHPVFKNWYMKNSEKGVGDYRYYYSANKECSETKDIINEHLETFRKERKKIIRRHFPGFLARSPFSARIMKHAPYSYSFYRKYNRWPRLRHAFLRAIYCWAEARYLLTQYNKLLRAKENKPCRKRKVTQKQKIYRLPPELHEVLETLFSNSLICYETERYRLHKLGRYLL